LRACDDGPLRRADVEVAGALAVGVHRLQDAVCDRQLEPQIADAAEPDLEARTKDERQLTACLADESDSARKRAGGERGDCRGGEAAVAWRERLAERDD